MHLVVLGQGIASEMALLGLLEGLVARGVTSDQSLFGQCTMITQISYPPLYPSVSLRSTAHVGVNGVEKGLSPLGDLIVAGVLELEKFLESHTQTGIYAGEHFHLYKKNDLARAQKLARRFGPNTQQGPLIDFLISKNDWHYYKTPEYVFYPLHFFSFLQKKKEKLLTQLNIDFHQIVGKVTTIDPGQQKVIVDERGGQEIHYDFLICGLGAFNVATHPFKNSDEIKYGQLRAGSYWSIEVDSHRAQQIFKMDDHKARVISLDGATMVIRKSPLGFSVLLGGTSSHKKAYIADARLELYQQYLKFIELFPSLVEIDFSQGEISTGLRHHLPKRMPYVGGMSGKNLLLSLISEQGIGNDFESLIRIEGLYKNGYNFAFLIRKLFLELSLKAKNIRKF